MTRRARLWLFLVAGAGLAVVLGFALAGLPGFDAELGRYASFVAHNAVSQRRGTNSVVDVAFDYRAVDTLAEELMIFVAAVGAAVLLTASRDEREEQHAEDLEALRAPSTSDLLRTLGGALAPVAILLGVYIVTHGALSPGGGFQGGVILAAALVFVFVAGRSVGGGRRRPVAPLEVVEALGAAGFALVGLGGILFASVFFENFLPLGTKGSLLSGGTIPLSNLAVGVEVAGAFALVFAELVDQMVLRRGGRG